MLQDIANPATPTLSFSFFTVRTPPVYLEAGVTVDMGKQK
jgi:hypothetical protein